MGAACNGNATDTNANSLQLLHLPRFLFQAAAKAYFKLALSLCRATRTPISLLLHPPDFMSEADEPRLSYLPGMKLPLADKLELVSLGIAKRAAAFSSADDAPSCRSTERALIDKAGIQS